MNLPIINLEATGARIKEIRKQKHLSVSELADLLELGSVQAVYRWEKGSCFPSIDNLYAMSRILEVPIDDIVRGSREEDISPPVHFIGGLFSKSVS